MANVLVVDDSSIMRRKLCSILTQAGHTIAAEAVNGDQAVRLYKRYKPNLVTMDITMPDTDGIGAVKEIISLDPEALIIMISALDQKLMVLAALQSGASHYILKPFDAEKVLSVVNKVLNESNRNNTRAAVNNSAKLPSKQQKFPGSLKNAITDITLSINDINSAIKELETEPAEKK